MTLYMYKPVNTDKKVGKRNKKVEKVGKCQLLRTVVRSGKQKSLNYMQKWRKLTKCV